MQISPRRRPIVARAGGPGSGARGSGTLLRAQAFVSADPGFCKRCGGLASLCCSRFLDLLVFSGRPGQAGPAQGPRRRLPQPEAEAEVRGVVGAAAFAGAWAGPRLFSVLHASGARPAPEQQQP